MILAREYGEGMINRAIAKAREIPRQQALRRLLRPPINKRTKFVVSFDPRLPSIPNVTKKHWRSMIGQNEYLKSVFPDPPLVSYKRQKNIRESIVRAKVAPERQPRIKKGVTRCTKCLACSYLKEGKTIEGRDYTNKKFTWKIGRSISCQSRNIVYLLECDKSNCRKQYIGVTGQELRERIYQHVGYVRNKLTNKATGQHFNLPGHAIHNMKFTVIE